MPAAARANPATPVAHQEWRITVTGMSNFVLIAFPPMQFPVAHHDKLSHRVDLWKCSTLHPAYKTVPVDSTQCNGCDASECHLSGKPQGFVATGRSKRGIRLRFSGPRVRSCVTSENGLDIAGMPGSNL